MSKGVWTSRCAVTTSEMGCVCARWSTYNPKRVSASAGPPVYLTHVTRRVTLPLSPFSSIKWTLRSPNRATQSVASRQCSSATHRVQRRRAAQDNGFMETQAAHAKAPRDASAKINTSISSDSDARHLTMRFRGTAVTHGDIIIGTGSRPIVRCLTCA